MLHPLRIIALLITLCGIYPSMVYAEEEKMTIAIKRLTMETALTIAKATIDQCRKEGVQVSVTIVDRSGHPQVVLRDVLAMDITLPVSRQKAHTAMAFNTPLSQLESRFTSPFQVAKLDGLIVAAGGIPINIGGSILGGIGVSGAPSGKTDEKCARAGLLAVSDDLEMDGM